MIMYGLSVYIEPKDILNRLSDEDKGRFNTCVFTDVHREQDGSVTIDCIVFDDTELHEETDIPRRQNYFNEGSLEVE